MKSLIDYICESSSKVSLEDVKRFIQMQKDLGFKTDGTDLDNLVDVFLSYYDTDEVCKVLNISKSGADTKFSIKQKIKTEFRKLS